VSLLESVAAAVDGLVARAHVGPNLRASVPRLGDNEEWPDLAAATAEYDRPEHYQNPGSFFPEPGAAAPQLTEVRPLGITGRVFDARWPSCAPFSRNMPATPPATVESHQGAARLFLHREPPRAAAMLIHGYLGGRYLVEEQVWPVRALYQRGVDVALFTLPFHGVRKAAGARGAPGFPSADPRVTNEGVRQAIFDLRGLMRFFHARGTPRVGAMGMSLGGYTTALLATLEPALAFAVPVVPLADLTEFARGHVPDPAPLETVRASHAERVRAHRVVSPFARPSVIAPERVVVVGAAVDRMAPPAHAQALAEHFKAPLELLPGGHLLMFGRALTLGAVERLVDAARDDASRAA
jgi:dienelactone hydrolase